MESRIVSIRFGIGSFATFGFVGGKIRVSFQGKRSIGGFEDGGLAEWRGKGWILVGIEGRV